MSKVHYRVNVLYETLDGPACGYQAPGALTLDFREVTCPECRALCGLDLTQTHGDPFVRGSPVSATIDELNANETQTQRWLRAAGVVARKLNAEEDK